MSACIPSSLATQIQIQIPSLQIPAVKKTHRNDDNCTLLSYSQLLKNYIRTRNIAAGRRLHRHLVESNLPFDPVLYNSLITLYSKCNHLDLAWKVFDEMGQRRDVVSWTAMISAAAHNHHPGDSLALFNEFLSLGFTPNEFTFSSIIQACAIGKVVEFGLVVLGFAIKMGVSGGDVSVGCALIDMFAKMDDLVSARKVFDGMVERNVVVWTLMITRCMQCGFAKDAVDLFLEMGNAGFLPDQFTMSGVMSACTELASIRLGKQLHSLAIRNGLVEDGCVGCCVVDMYAKCGTGGSLVDTRKAFDRMVERNVMSWTATIAAYVQNGGHDIEAIKLFLEMIISGEVHPNHFTYSSILKACANIGDAELGEQVHAHVVKSGLSSVNFVGNSLVSVYSQAGRMEEARKAFEILFDKNLVTYNAIVDGYIKNSNTEEAFELVRQTENLAIGVDAFTFASLLSAAASIGAMSKGQQLHAQLLKAGFMSDICVGNALVSAYSRCGNIEDASTVFEDMNNRNVISWTSMITGFAKHGHAHQALAVFDVMTSQGIRPNEVTYIAVLSACSHAGLVREGYANFDLMQRRYGLVPKMEHYACMVDLLGRVGSLDEAFEFIKSMPFRADALVWRTLLGACRVHKHVELGKIAAKCLLELEPKDPAAHVLLSNLYAMAGKWDGVAKIRKGMKEKGLNKEAGLSWVEMGNEIHKFHVGDTSHARACEIFDKLDELVVKIKAMGYVVDTQFVLHDLDDELKEKYILQHSEKIAVAFGLVATTTPRPIRVFKNLRVCGDCHNAIKFISKATGREIIVRDSNRFHRFINGECSCGEYW